MRKFYILISLLSSIHLFCQGDFNMALVSKIDWGEGGSGSWGHTDPRGIEYAIIGTTKSIKILSLENPKNPKERISIPGANTTWREARAFGNFIYVTTESVDGVTIIDITKGPDSITWKRWKPEIPNVGNILTTHSINMDELGYLYLNGNNTVRGVAIFDTNKDGNNPELKSIIASPYTHDCYATKTILYTADLSGGVGVYDIKDKTKPILLNRFATTKNFTHNMWTSPDEKYLFTTDETSGAAIDAYDVTDPKNIKLLGKYQNLDTRIDKTIPHNVYAVNQNFAATAYYTDGVVITDMSRPDNIIKVGSYDTYLPSGPENGSWFLGCWGIYPFLKSGHIIASDMSTGFYLLKPEYKRASYLEGKTLLKNQNGILSPISDAVITIKASKKAFGTSNANGIYKTGIAEAGLYTVIFTHPTFKTDSVQLTLKTGEVVNYDFIINAQSANGKVFDDKNIAIKNSQVLYTVLPNADALASSNFDALSVIRVPGDSTGTYSVLVQTNQQYSLMATAWGYEPKEIKFTNTPIPNIQLKQGLKDDFITDLGWKNTIKAVAGNWERGKPIGTTNAGLSSNPARDADGDVGNMAFVTGVAGGAVGDFDVDGGTTTLESPSMNFIGFDSVVINYQKWFYNGGGSGVPNDKFTIYLSNGTTQIPLETINTNTVTWVPSEISITKKDILFTSNMKIVLETGDDAIGHIVEAGFDNFSLKLLKTILPTKDEFAIKYKIFPNPFSHQINIVGDDIKEVELIDLMGRSVRKSQNNVILTDDIIPGVYTLKVTSKGGQTNSSPCLVKSK
jgi:choice-of-anchor B domain-containing protein